MGADDSLGVADWERIQELFDAALGLDAPARDAFLAAACKGDDALLEEVRSLLAAHDDAGSFIQPLVATVVEGSPSREVGATIPVGTRFGSHEVVARLGAGGMGEVYRAHDSKLGRDVAIKILPRQFAADADRRARLEREARLLATLNHPHIGGIYGLEDREGVLALVLELVEGETLAERIARSRPGKPAIKVREALSIARQIADALEAAHDKGIVHRDLKPANIKVTPAGTVKVLDFGIAKTREADASGGDPSLLPAMGAAGTGLGAVIGTPAYMSPEQALGQDIDKRTDIWAFGCVLYEMLTGRGVFGGDTPSETMAAILERVPEWHALPTATPSGIRRLLQRCLDSDPSRRLHDIADARLEIDDALASPAAETLAVTAAPSRGVIPVAIVALAGGAVIALVAWAYTRPSPRAPEPPSRFAIVLPRPEPLSLYGDGRSVALSPDGRHLVYRAGGMPIFGSPLLLRDIDQLDAKPLGDVPWALGPFFSPDSLSVGFFGSNGEQGNLFKVAIRGGPAVWLCRIVGMPLGASWGDDNTIVFATQEPGMGLMQVSASGGQPTVLTRLDTTQGETYHMFPSVLPGGRGVLFTIDSEKDDLRVAILDRKTGQRKTLIDPASDAEYVESGHLIYAVGDTLLVVGFDPVRLEVVGDPVPVAETVMRSPRGAAHYAVSRSGTLIYAPGGTGAQQSLVWVDRKGREEAISAPARRYYVPRLSPDGTRVVVSVWDPDADFWIGDLVRDRWTRLTTDPANDLYPVWTPDSRRIIFASARDRLTVYNVYSVAADGAGTTERLTTSAHWQLPSSITPDGTRIVGHGQSDPDRQTNPGANLDVITIPVKSPTKEETLLHTPFNESAPEVSPNGRYIAYLSGESSAIDVYVRPFPHVDRGVWKVSREGGSRAKWARNGRELFYVDGSKALMAVPVDTFGPTFSAGAPAKVFDAAKYSTWYPPRNYDVSPDGQRFLMIKDGPPVQLIVVQHWFEALKGRVSTGPQ